MADVPVRIPEGKAGEEETKPGFPEIERDAAPSSVIPAALKCIQQTMKKVSAMIKRYTDVQKKQALTALEARSLLQCLRMLLLALWLYVQSTGNG